MKMNLKKKQTEKQGVYGLFLQSSSANYGSDVSKGLNTASYYFVFLALCWIPIIAGVILLRKKGWETDLYKYDLVVGYGIFYTFVISTTESPIAFTYVLPVTKSFGIV